MREKWTDLEPREEEFLKDWGAPVSTMRARHAHCPSPQLLLAAQSEALPGEIKAGLADHLASCDLCRALARDLADEELSNPTTQEKARISKRVLGESRAGRRQAIWNWLWRPAPVAAVAVVAVLAVLSVYVGWESRRPGPGPVASQPPTVLRLDKAAVKLPATAVLVWRGDAQERQQRYLAELTRALEPYRADDFAEALRRLEVLERNYPRAAEAHFYAGVCQLFLGFNSDAVRSFENARGLAEEPLAPDVAWYLSLAYQRAGQTQQAMQGLQDLCQGKSEYRERACAGLKELSSGGGGVPAR